MTITAPFTAQNSTSPSPTPPLSPSASLNPEPGAPSGSLNPRWSPTGDDHLIYEWVKMQGKTQREVASMFGIDQSTVSRVIQRMERWQAHAKARENGRLDPSERLRAQRWLTYERNELILASCLRIAQEMEGFTDVSTTTISRPVSKPSQEREIRTQNSTIDRHGIAARFLRLAFRINMDQLKLTAQIARDGDMPPEPLTDEQLAAEARQAAADAAEIAAAKVVPSFHEGLGDEPAIHPAQDPAGQAPSTSKLNTNAEPVGEVHATASQPANLTITISPSLPPSVSPSLLHPPLHNLHNENPPEIAATAAKPCTCVPQPRPEKNSADTCITDRNQPPWADDDNPQASPGGRPTLPLHLQELASGGE